MKIIFIFFILFVITYSADIIVDVIPDTIFVGSLATIIFKVENMNNEEVAVFHDLDKSSSNYSNIDKVLENNSAKYTLQFWNSGYITIPSVIIDINKYNQNISQIKTKEIKLNILTNIPIANTKLREIKPMNDVELTSPMLNILFLILLLSGLLASGYLWSKRIKYKTSKFSQVNYYQSSFIDTLHAIESLPLPKNIDSEATENYYLKLSEICRLFINEHFYIKATKMTSSELIDYFKFIGMEGKLIDLWIKISTKTDMAKYAKQISHINEYHEDKLNIKNIIQSFNEINIRKLL